MDDRRFVFERLLAWRGFSAFLAFLAHFLVVLRGVIGDLLDGMVRSYRIDGWQKNATRPNLIKRSLYTCSAGMTCMLVCASQHYRHYGTIRS